MSLNFHNLPSRTLLNYYKLIKHPVSLRGLQKLVRGIKGHAPPSGSTLLKSWKAFEEEASFIWKNAREYNEDSSEIVRLASILQVYPDLGDGEAQKLIRIEILLPPVEGGKSSRV